MGGGKHPSDIVVSIAAGLFGGIFVVTLAHMHQAAALRWCLPDEANCVRDWIAALSGWAATAAATVTAAFIFGQFREARNQTRVISGDASPTITVSDPPDLAKASDAFQNRLVVINWNRHPIVIHNILIGVDAGHQIADIEIVGFGSSNPRAKFVHGQFEQGHLMLEGWTDRTKEPPRFTFNVAVANPRIDDNTRDWSIVRREHVEFAVNLTVLGPKADNKRLTLDHPFTIIL